MWMVRAADIAGCGTDVVGDPAGRVRRGFLANLLLADGDPATDVERVAAEGTAWQHSKGRQVHKRDRAALTRRLLRAAESDAVTKIHGNRRKQASAMQGRGPV